MIFRWPITVQNSAQNVGLGLYHRQCKCTAVQQ